MRHLLTLLALLPLGCGQLDPSVGETREDLSGAATCSLEPSGEEVAYETIQAEIFDKQCRCHVVPGGFGQTLGGLDLSSYDALFSGGRNAGEEDIIVAGDPCNSVLIQKTQDPPPFGARMPFNSSRLSDADLQRLVDWIAAGAKE